MAETTITVDSAPEGEVEEVQEQEHEIQAVESEQWQSALSNVTAQLAELSARIAERPSMSPETQQLLETQREMIASLQAQSTVQGQQLQEIVDKFLLTQPRQPEVLAEPLTVTTLADPVEALAGPEVLPEQKARRYRGL
jgi:hypothetical protein